MSNKTNNTMLDECLREELEFYGNASNAKVSSSKSIFKLFTDIPLTFFNVVAFTDLKKDDFLKELREIKDHSYKKRIGIHWLVRPDDRPFGIKEILKDSGFSYSDRVTGMILRTVSLNNTSGNKDVETFMVNDDKSLSAWIRSSMEEHPEHELFFDRIFAFEKSLGLGPESRWLRFNVKLNGKNVGTSALFLAGKVALIDNISTKIKYRRKGIASKAVSDMVRLADKKGYETCVLFSSEMGKPLYGSLGFRGDYIIEEYVLKTK